MNVVKKFFTIFLVLFNLITPSLSQDQIVYLDLENVVNNTKIGKSILSKLEASKIKALSKFEVKEKLVEFRKEVSSFRQERQKVINNFNQKKKEEFEEFFKKITPIIENYVSENKIDIVLDKKNIFIASKKKEITQEIIEIIDSKIK